MLLLSVCCSATSAHSDAIPKNINEFAGRRCNTPKKGSGLVVGYFSGYSDDAFINDDGYQSVDRYRCFPTLSECRGGCTQWNRNMDIRPLASRFAKSFKLLAASYFEQGLHKFT